MELIQTLRKIRACENEVAAQLLLEAFVDRKLAEVREELALTDGLLAERNRLLAVIPACKMHGEQCVPGAIEWVEAAKQALAASQTLLNVLGLDPEKGNDGGQEAAARIQELMRRASGIVAQK